MIREDEYRFIVPVSSPGGLRNGYCHLGDFIEWFPDDVIGGKNHDLKADKEVTLQRGGSASTTTDIDGQKKIIRDRSWFPALCRLHELKVGDAVQFSRIDDYQYAVTPIRAEVYESGVF